MKVKKKKRERREMSERRKETRKAVPYKRTLIQMQAQAQNSENP